MLFLDDRLLFAKNGGQGLAAQAVLTAILVTAGTIGGAFGGLVAAMLAGALGGLIGALIYDQMQKSASKRQDQRAKDIMAMTREELLRLDKDNFELPYGAIFSVDMRKSSASWSGPRIGVLSITGSKRQQFDIGPNQSYDDFEKTIDAHLPNKRRPV